MVNVSTIGDTPSDYTRADIWETNTQGDLADHQRGEVKDQTVTQSTNVIVPGLSGDMVTSTYQRKLTHVAGARFDVDTATGALLQFNSTALGCLRILEGGFECEGLGLRNTSTSNGSRVIYEVGTLQSGNTGNGTTKIHKCTVLSATTLGAVTEWGAATRSVWFYNNIVSTEASGDGQYGVAFSETVGSGYEMRFHSNLALDIDAGGSYNGDGFYCDGTGTNSGSIFVTNNIGFGSTGNDFDNMTAIAGTHTEDYNASEDTTAAGANSVTGLASGDFEDMAGDDFTPSATSKLLDEGEDLSSLFTDDYKGNTRSGTWDIGPIERVSGAVTVNPTPATIGAASTSPTVKWGVKVSPTVGSSPALATSPSVAYGVAVSPTVVTSTLTAVVGASVAAGTLVSPTTVTMPCGADTEGVVSVVTGTLVSVSTPATSPAASTAPSVATGTAVAPSVATSGLVAVEGVIVSTGGGPVEVLPTPGVIGSVAPAPAVKTGTTVSPTPALVGSVAPAPSVKTGLVLSPLTAGVPFVAPDPGVATGVVVSVTQATSAFVAPAPSVTAGIVVSPDVATAPVVAPSSPSLTLGQVLSPTPALIGTTAPAAPSVLLGLAVTPDPAALSFTAPVVTITNFTPRPSRAAATIATAKSDDLAIVRSARTDLEK